MNQDVMQQLGRQQQGWSRTMILSHTRPDGDALGAMGAMKRVIESRGGCAVAYTDDEVPDRYQFLQDSCGFTRWPGGPADVLDGQFDGILILDTCSWMQMEYCADYLRTSALPKIIVDHHATRDELPNASCLIDASSASTCELVYTWCEALCWTIDLPAATALFTGITTDTGWFRFSNTSERTLRIAAQLMKTDIRPDRLYAMLYASYSLNRLKLMAEMLATLEFHADGALAIMHITGDMLRRTGAKSADTEELVNEPMAARSVIVSVLLSETDDGRVRVSFRSKSPEIAGRDVDVAAIARQFGGGGHCRAAGARFKDSLDKVREHVTAAIVSVLNA